MKPQPIILGETFAFTRIYWKSFRVIYGLIFYPIFLMFFFSRPLHFSQNILIFFTVLFSFSFLITIRIWGLMTKLTISPEGITYSTIFGSRTVDWSSIKSSGVFLLYKNSREELPAHRIAEKFRLKEKFIFLSRQPNYSPGSFSFWDRDYFDFHYRDKAWELIDFYLGKKENKTSALNFQ